MGGRLRASKEEMTAATARANALADQLEAGVSKRALAEVIASRATVRGIIERQSPAQIQADLLAELRRYEQVAALRRFGGKTGRKA